MNQVRSEVAKITRLGVVLRVYVYEIDGLLVDTGPYSALNQLKPFFNQINIDQIALTHIHEDHSGNANWLSKKKHVPIYVHESSLEYAKQNGKYPFYRRLYWGPRKPFDAKPLPNIIETENYKLKVLETPGHSADSVSLYEENNGWLFTGDLYITQKPKLFLKEESIIKTIQSLEMLLELDINNLYCSHTGRVSNGKQKLRGKLNYLLQLQDDVWTLQKQGLSNREIEKQLFPGSSPLIYISRKEFSYSRAIESIIKNE